MAVRVWREWLATSLVLVVGACSGKAGQHDIDPSGTGGATSRSGSSGLSPGKMLPGQPTQTVGGSAVTGSAGAAPVMGGRGGAGGGFSAGAPPEVAGAGGADDDVPGIVVSASGDHTLYESYGTVQVQVRLTAQPLSSVEVGLVSTDPAHAVVFPLSLVFTPENWSKAQGAVVVGVRDLVADDGNTVIIETLPAVSTDPRYTGLDAADFDVFVINETDAGIVVGAAAGGVTAEPGTATTFNIVLTSRPTATVTIPLSSNDLTEGTVPESIVFEPNDWNVPHPVTVTGVDDQLADGAQSYQITTGAAVSTDLHYSGLDPADVAVSNLDNDS
jgi:large repetitive protein